MKRNSYIIGTKYNKLTLLKIIEETNKHTKGLFKCECGKEKEINMYAVYAGRTKSCGCSKGLYFKKSLENNEEYHENIKKRAKRMGINSRKYDEICTFCNKMEHYAKGLCKNCYNKERRGTLYKNI